MPTVALVHCDAIGLHTTLGKRRLKYVTTHKNSTDKINYAQFREQWLVAIEEGNPSTLHKARRFAAKLVTQWQGITTEDDDFVVCDGSGDGGIDVAYLKRADTDVETHDDNSIEGDAWYLVQSKYGTSFSGSDTILIEGQKVISTLVGQNQHLSHDTQQLLDKLTEFRQRASNADRIVLVLATTDQISQKEREVFDSIRVLGRERISPIFDIEEVSLYTIWEGLDDVEHNPLSVAIEGQFVEQSSGLLVGTSSLLSLFGFMQSYQRQTGDLNQLYQKNVRQFLGGRRKINKGIAETLRSNPEKFGLYNNGITVVVSGYVKSPRENVITMHDPYIVNGCQTTKTIWQVLDSKLNAGGTGNDSVDATWREQVDRGGVIVKIVRSDEAEITNITRYTNSQNSVREQDFIALNSGFQGWAAEMSRDYNVFLEIQRGAADARKAWEKQHPDQGKYDDYVNAFDLIKVYGAGWIGVPGIAFGKNAPFLPRGSVYERTMSRPERDTGFGAADLYAAFKVKGLADEIGFGRFAKRDSRRQSRFLFFHVFVQMLKNVIVLTPELDRPAGSMNDLTEAILRLSTCDAKGQLSLLQDGALALIDQYLTHGSANCAHKEASFLDSHNGDMNAFLKAPNLGKEDHSPLLVQALHIQNAAFNMGNPSPRVQVSRALLGD